jgi:hypothetical protein
VKPQRKPRRKATDPLLPADLLKRREWRRSTVAEVDHLFEAVEVRCDGRRCRRCKNLAVFPLMLVNGYTRHVRPAGVAPAYEVRHPSGTVAYLRRFPSPG